MSLVSTLLISVFTLLLIQFVLLEAVEKRLHHANTAGKFALAGAIALLKTVRQFAILAILVYSAVWIAVALGSFSWARDPETFGEAVKRLGEMRERIEHFSDRWSETLAIILAVALAIIFYLRRKRSVVREISASFHEAAARVMPDIRAEAEGSKHPLPPTPKMLKCAAAIDAVEERLTKETRDPERQRLYQLRSELQQQYIMLDVDRRLGTEVEAVPSLTRGRRWRRLFSQGLLDDLKGIPKLAAIVANALLLASLLSVSGHGIARELSARAAKLSDAQIEATINKQKQELHDLGLQPDQPPAANSTQPAPPLNARDEATIQHAAAAYERAFTQSKIFDQRDGHGYAHAPASAASDHARPADKNNLVRDAILSDAGPFDAGHAGPTAAATPDPDGPVTKVGSHFADDLRSSFRTASESVRQRFRDKFASYHQPLEPLSAEQFIIGQVFGEAVDFAKHPFADSGFLSEQAIDFVKDFGGDQVGESYERLRNEVLTGAFGNDTAQDALRRVNDPKRPIIRADRAADVRRSFADSAVRAASDDVYGKHPPSAKAPPEDNPKLAEVVKDLNAARGPGAEPLTDPLLAYNDIAPDAVGAEMNTAHGAVSSALDGAAEGVAQGVARGVAQGAGEAVEESAFRFTMGRSFSMLAGSFRVGGVLIGIEPQARPLAFRDIGWTVENDRVRIFLVDAGGARLEVGSYPRSTVVQALNYAADGRPLAATMVSAPPLADLKILVHPALIDTPLGARIVEMDRYVDRFTGDDPARIQAEKVVYSQQALYEIAWYRRQAALGIGNSLMRGSRLDSAAEEAALALASPDTFRDKTTSLLVAKPEFYDKSLVQTMAACPKSAVEAFGACIEQAYKGASIESAWKDEPPAFQIWSGVRELPYTPDQPLNFLTRRADDLWPFTFLVQVAFMTPPAFARQSAAEYADTTPFELSSLTARIRSAVASGIASHPQDKDSFESVREFAILQRLFRVALNGELGSAFPTEKLVSLKRAARSTPAICKTPRWNPHPDMVEAKFLRTIVELNVALARVPDDSGALSQLHSQISTCLSLARRRTDLDRIPVADWNQSCGFDAVLDAATSECPEGDGVDTPGCAAKAVARLAAITSKTRQIRFAAGIPALETPHAGLCVGGAGAL